MSDEISIGSKVKYHTGDEKWKNGTIHGIRKVDDIQGIPRVFTYLVDTGGDQRVDVFDRNLKNDARNAEYMKHISAGAKHEDAMDRSEQHVAGLQDEIIKDVVRQPEQVDVRPEYIKTR